MNFPKTDKNPMVKMTITRADGSTADEKWFCKRIDGLKPAPTKAPKAENLDEPDDVDSWYYKISSHLEIELKEGEDGNSSWSSSYENDDNHPIDLSKNLSTHRESLQSKTKNPMEVHNSKSKFPGNVYGVDLTLDRFPEGDKIKVRHGETSYNSRNTFSRNPPPMEIPMTPQGPSTSHNFPINQSNFSMNYRGDFRDGSGFVNTKNPEIAAQNNIPPAHLKQEAPRTIKTDIKHFGRDLANYNHSRNGSHLNANPSYGYSSKGNAGTDQLGNVLVPRTGNNFSNNLPQNNTNNLKHASKNSVQISRSDTSNSTGVPKRVKLDAKASDHPLYCVICDRRFKSHENFNKHMASGKHSKKMSHDASQQSNLNQSNSESKPLPGPTNLQPQPQVPNLLHLFQNRMWFNPLQVPLMTPQALVNNICPPGQMRFPNYFATGFFPPGLGYMNLPFSQANMPQGIFLPPNKPQSEVSMLANPKSLENKAFQSSHAPKYPSTQTQPEELIAANSVHKLAVQNPEVRFRTYICKVCLKFYTNSLRELEMHLNANRIENSHEFVVTVGKNLLCKLCNFQTPHSGKMVQHSAGKLHFSRVAHYNHLMEGQRQETFRDSDKFSPVSLYCAACEYETGSIDALKVHDATRNHQYNVSSCMYIDSFSTAAECYICRPCNLKTSKKVELIIHARSDEHKKALRGLPSYHEHFYDAKQVFFIKELDSNSKEPHRVLKPNEGLALIGRKDPDLRNEEPNMIGIPSQEKSSSSSSQPLRISCTLCQKEFPEISFLVQHLQQIHGVNEAGVKWLVSAANEDDFEVHEQKSLPTGELANEKAGEVKNVVVSPQKSSTNDKLLVKGMSIDTSSNHGTAEIGFDKENEPLCSRPVKQAEKNMAAVESVNHEGKTNVIVETECLSSLEKLDQNSTSNHDGSNRPNFSSSQVFNGTENIRNFDKLDEDSRSDADKRTYPNSSYVNFCETEDILDSGKSDQDSNLQQEERMNIDSNSNQKFSETESIFPIEEEYLPSLPESLDFDLLQDEMTDEYISESNEDSKYKAGSDDSSNAQFSSTETGSLISHSALNTSIESIDSFSSNDSSIPYNWLPRKEKSISSESKCMEVDSSSNQHYVLDSENDISSLEDQSNLHLRRDENKHSPVDFRMALVESEGNVDSSTSGMNENLNISLKDQKELKDGSYEAGAQFSSQNSPVTIDLQKQALKNLENIEISGVFSLRDHVYHFNNNDEDQEYSDV